MLASAVPSINERLFGEQGSAIAADADESAAKPAAAAPGANDARAADAHSDAPLPSMTTPVPARVVAVRGERVALHGTTQGRPARSLPSSSRTLR